MAAMAPMRELMAQVMENTRSTLMPMIFAAFTFCWVARMAMPSLEYLKKRNRSTMIPP